MTSRLYQVSGLCKGCDQWNKFTGLIGETPACPNCGFREPQDKLDKLQATMDAFEADPVKQAAIREIRAKVDRGKHPFADVEIWDDDGDTD